MATRTFERVYVWEAPVRFYHWANVIVLTLLVATGFVIGRPPAFLSGGEAWSAYWFGIVRFLHFAAAFAFLFLFVLRVYWMFAGNRYARWDNFLPITPRLIRRQFGDAGRVLKEDIFQITRGGHEDLVGHNALAAWSYLAVFLLTIFQIATGFALYAPMSGSWLPQLFTWVTPLMGGDAAVRTWHHVATWFFVAFAIIHVYLSIFHDVVGGRGEISSIVSGSKFVGRRS